MFTTIKRKIASVFGGTAGDAGAGAEEVHVESSAKRRRLALGVEDCPRRSAANAPPVLCRPLSSPDGGEEPPLEVPSSKDLSPLVAISASSTTCFNRDTVELKGNNAEESSGSDLLRILPRELLLKTLGFVGSSADRFALQLVCRTFRDLSNSEEILKNTDLIGVVPAEQGASTDDEENDDEENEADEDEDIDDDELAINRGTALLMDMIRERNESKHVLARPDIRGFIISTDTSESAARRLLPFVLAGNVQATYMLSIILCYCHENLREGLALLRLAASQNHLESSFTLSLLLRDSKPTEAAYYLNVAATGGYLPAWQEKLGPVEMRVRFGDLDAQSLESYLDAPCLNRLISRHYVSSRRTRGNQTSHCWNPICGRWAYKQVASNNANLRDHCVPCIEPKFSFLRLLPQSVSREATGWLEQIRHALESEDYIDVVKSSRMKMCSSCRRAKVRLSRSLWKTSCCCGQLMAASKYCSKLCQVYVSCVLLCALSCDEDLTTKRVHYEGLEVRPPQM